ncbi:MAG: RagB/SusD family nutrient uptake outer membrane protein [Candidatus Azobacteroides sp.]|nr:RagB/SusD family nutrient uptake outer membrane protein [Candidatus Azobacteroides sp.]
MKRLINKIIILLVACMGFTACIDDFLNRPADNMTPVSDMTDIVKTSNSIYVSYRNMPESAGDALYAMGEIASDNALRGSILSDGGGLDAGKQFNQFQNFNGINPSSTNYIAALWNGLYPGIDQANINLRAFSSLFKNESDSIKKPLIAENRFGRAWFYMQLVNAFGEVPLLPEGEVTPKEYSQLTNDKSVIELYQYIIKDFRYAADSLPTKAEWKTLYNIDWQGRAHKSSGQGYLAKSLLYLAANYIYYDKTNGAVKADSCYKAIVEIVREMEPDYPALYPDYEKIFRPEGDYCSESVFEVGVSSTSDGTTYFAGWRPNQPRNYTGYGRLGPSLNLIKQYETDPVNDTIIDVRHRGTVLYGGTSPLSFMEHPAVGTFERTINGENITGVVTSNAISTGWPNRYCRKAAQPRPTSTSVNPLTNFGGNLKFLRWGEVLLIGAEAAYYTGDYDLAKKWVKQIRVRAHLDPTIVDNLSGQALLDLIWKEKRLEIALEWSNRYYEMVRIDKIHPGYMATCFNAKIEDEFAGMEKTLLKGGSIVINNTITMDIENYRTVMPLNNGLRLPRNYTMPIPTVAFTTMVNLRQTQYYR